MPIPISIVDAFTAEPFAGNPAAVCLLPEPAAEAWMQDVAREMSLSETAFLVPEEGSYRLRWFTPAREVDLCGHATLASAHLLWLDGHLAPGDEARFDTLSGRLTARRLVGGWIEMDFPAAPPEPAEPPPGLLEALGLAGAVWIGRNRFDWMIELGDQEAVLAVAPDFRALGRIDARGIAVTARAASHEHDFVSRFFAPAYGIDEDPVTGSAHCCLGPYWAAKLGKEEVTGRQASARGGTVRVTPRGGRVILSGQAVRVMKGELA
jgi:predicted PhzF superfamily epimerase YddE/YHI9